MYKRVKITLWVKIKEKLHAERLHPDNMSATRYFILFSGLLIDIKFSSNHGSFSENSCMDVSSPV